MADDDYEGLVPLPAKTRSLSKGSQIFERQQLDSRRNLIILGFSAIAKIAAYLQGHCLT